MAPKHRFSDERDKIIKGLEEAYRKMIIRKRQTNSAVVVMRDGKVTEVDPFDMPSTTVYKCGSGK
jgi:hypothetical protein